MTQATDFLNIYNKYKDIPGGQKLIPMLDLESDRRNETKTNKKNCIVEYYKPNEFKENSLKWLQYIEKSTGITPGIYVGAKAYGDYLRGDKRFNKYLIWLSAYSTNNSNGRETGNVRRINFKEGSVNVGNKDKPITVKPAMYQSSQEGSVPGTSAKHTEKDRKTYYDTDMNHTKDITKLFSENNKSK